MRTGTGMVAALCLLLAALAVAPAAAPADPLGGFAEAEALRKKPKPRGVAQAGPVLRSWMSPEIADAWRQGFTGRGVTVTVIDDFRSARRAHGDLGLGMRLQRHGEWTRQEVSLLAPGATYRTHDFSSGSRVVLALGLNVVNLSYGMFATAGYDVGRIGWSGREASLIAHAREGRAVIAKAAGNDAVAVGAATAEGRQDYLNSALVGARSAIFVGALERNGTVERPAALAGYSNFAGADPAVQDHFLVVGVEGHRTGLHGTSFAAPVVSGYSAVLGSKFTRATPTQIADQLLATARRDTVAGYDAAVHGRGEASIARALAPVTIK